MTHTVETLMALAFSYAYKYADTCEVEQDCHGLRTARTVLRAALTEALAQHPLMSSMSWGGFNLYGDAESINKAKNMLHESDTVPALKQRIRELQSAQPVQEAPLLRQFLDSAERDGVTHFSLPVAQPVPPDPYDQQSLELCNVCGWKTLIPGVGCLLCERDAQPVREPLSDEQIGMAWLATSDPVGLGGKFKDAKHVREFARAIEKAHGIGDKT